MKKTGKHWDIGLSLIIKYLDDKHEYEVITYVEPIYNGKNIIGLTGVDNKTSYYTNILDKIKVKNAGYSFLLNEKYDYILHKTLGSTENLSTIYNGKYKFIADKMKAENSGFVYCFFEKQKILGYAHLSNNWIIATSVPVDTMYEDIIIQIMYMIIIIIIGIIFATHIAINISEMISKPVERATEFAVSIADGNLDERLEIYTNDETKILFMSLNKAAQSISILINRLKETQGKLVLQIKNLRKSEEKISYLAYNNLITRLPNRNYLKREMPKILGKMKQNEEYGILIHMDIDNFRYINDILGHSKGDIYLRRFSKILKNSFAAQEAVLCSIGEDSYVFFIKGICSNEQISETIDKIQQLTRQSINVSKNRSLNTTSSMGVALFPSHGEDYETLLRCSDMALNLAKDKGKNRFEIYNTSMNDKMIRRINLENKLRKAIENDELYVNYQPKYNNDSKRMNSMEALLRWNNEEFGNVKPSEFIPIAEESGQIISIGEFVIRKSCKQIKEWMDKGLEPKSVAINISAKQIERPEIIEDVKRILYEEKISAQQIEFEITESVLMNNIQLCIDFIKQVRNIGIKVYLDDFGSQYSSLNYLKMLPVDYIKIDKSFIDEIASSKKDNFIVESLIQLAHGIELKVVAEGVETKEQFEILESYGCDEIQGYYFSKPLNSNEIDKYLFKEIL